MAKSPKAPKVPFTPTRYSRLVSIFFIVVTFSELLWLQFWKGNAPTGWGIWVFGDWLWNYGGGFARRGLGGEIVIALHRVTGIPVFNVLHLLLMALTAVFNLAAYRLIRHRFSAETLLVKTRGAKKGDLQKPRFELLLAVASPMAFAYPLADPLVVGHKELLVFSLFLWWLHLLRLELPKRQLIWFALAVAATELTNEMLLFFSVYFVAAFVFVYRDKAERKERIRQVRLPIVALLASAAAAIAFSRNSTRLAMCDRLVANGAPDFFCVGPLEWAGNGVDEAIAELLIEMRGPYFIQMYLGAFLLVLLPLFLMLRKTEVFAFAKRWMFICFIGVLPMFAVAQDWGRWVSMHAVLATLLTFGLLLPSKEASKLVANPKKRLLTGLFDRLTGILDALPGWLRSVVLSFWLFGWGVLHYGALATSIWSVLRGNSFDFWLAPRQMIGG